jgi:hypothetical protein
MLVSDFLGMAKEQLVDQGGVFWTEAEMLNYISLGYAAIITARPDANSILVTHDCVAGAIQEIPTTYDGAQLLAVRRNMIKTTVDGVTTYSSGKIPRLISGDLADSIMPTWFTAPANADGQIDEYIYDDRTPNTFYVYPNATANTALELLLSVLPAKHVDPTTETIAINTRYISPLLDYVMFRAYIRDSKDTHSKQMADGYLQRFNSAMGTKVTVDAQVQPNALEGN